jgi:hypothetical protein
LEQRFILYIFEKLSGEQSFPQSGISTEVQVVRIEVEELSEPEFLQAVVYWHTRRGNKMMPARADLNPVDLVKILPKVMLVDVLPHAPHFHFRVVGTNIADWIKFDATGQTLDAVEPENYRRMLFATYMECAGARAPTAHRILWDAKDVPHRYKRLIMPLASDSRNVDMLLITSVAESFEEAADFWKTAKNITRY